jgi:hypothetical protein
VVAGAYLTLLGITREVLKFIEGWVSLSLMVL